MESRPSEDFPQTKATSLALRSKAPDAHEDPFEEDNISIEEQFSQDLERFKQKAVQLLSVSEELSTRNLDTPYDDTLVISRLIQEIKRKKQIVKTYPSIPKTFNDKLELLLTKSLPHTFIGLLQANCQSTEKALNNLISSIENQAIDYHEHQINIFQHIHCLIQYIKLGISEKYISHEEMRMFSRIPYIKKHLENPQAYSILSDHHAIQQHQPQQAKKLIDSFREIYQLLFESLTSLKELENQVDILAQYSSLTYYNRTTLEDEIYLHRSMQNFINSIEARQLNTNSSENASDDWQRKIACKFDQCMTQKITYWGQAVKHDLETFNFRPINQMEFGLELHESNAVANHMYWLNRYLQLSKKKYQSSNSVNALLQFIAKWLIQPERLSDWIRALEAQSQCEMSILQLTPYFQLIYFYIQYLENVTDSNTDRITFQLNNSQSSQLIQCILKILSDLQDTLSSQVGENVSELPKTKESLLEIKKYEQLLGILQAKHSNLFSNKIIMNYQAIMNQINHTHSSLGQQNRQYIKKLWAIRLHLARKTQDPDSTPLRKTAHKNQLTFKYHQSFFHQDALYTQSSFFKACTSQNSTHCEPLHWITLNIGFKE